jgi:hypothetical protein
MTGKNSPRGLLISIAECGARTGLARQTLYNQLSGRVGIFAEVPFYKIGTSVRISETDLESYLSRRRVEPRTGTAG